jgi:subtilisin family serine protease
VEPGVLKGVNDIGIAEGPVQDEEEVDRGLARTQLYAAIVIIVLVVAVIAVAIAMERPDDDVERSTWAYEMVQLDQANEMGLTGSGVTIGLIDTGIDPDHPCLVDVEIVAWKDYVLNDTDPYDDDGHGTAMASIIAGRSPLKGGAPEADLIVVKVLDSDHPINDTTVADAIDFCLDPDEDDNYSDSADIISLSLGGDYEGIDILQWPKTKAAISEAVRIGVICVAAAGNDGDAEDVAFPSRIPEVISVGAVDERGQVAPFSSPGNDSVERPDPNKKPEVVAPGVDIVTAYKDGLYAKGSGTSHATAFTTAALAVALSAAPGFQRAGTDGGNLTTVEAVKTALMVTAQPVQGQMTKHNSTAGYGLVQAVDLALELRD